MHDVRNTKDALVRKWAQCLLVARSDLREEGKRAAHVPRMVCINLDSSAVRRVMVSLPHRNTSDMVRSGTSQASAYQNIKDA